MIQNTLAHLGSGIDPSGGSCTTARAELVGRASPFQNDGGSGGVLEGEVENGAQISVIYGQLYYCVL